MPLSLKALKEHPIYPELIAIGRDDQMMRAEVLAKYDYLLKSPEVLRRAGSETNRALLAAYAREALFDAIAHVAPPKRREVAEVALCSTEVWEGLKLNERLLDLPGIDERRFKYQRELAFKSIIEYLDTPQAVPARKRPVSGSVTKPPRHPSERDRYRLALEHVAELAAMLHYGGLGALFAYGFDEELRANGIAVWSLDRHFPRITLADYLFTTYIGLVYDDTFNLYLGTAGFSEMIKKLPGLYSEYLPPKAIGRLRALYDAIADGSPAGPHGLTRRQSSEFSAYQPFGLASDLARDIYRTKWLPAGAVGARRWGSWHPVGLMPKLTLWKQ